jgi:hypothetical protein
MKLSEVVGGEEDLRRRFTSVGEVDSGRKLEIVALAGKA